MVTLYKKATASDSTNMVKAGRDFFTGSLTLTSWVPRTALLHCMGMGATYLNVALWCDGIQEKGSRRSGVLVGKSARKPQFNSSQAG